MREGLLCVFRNLLWIQLLEYPEIPGTVRIMYFYSIPGLASSFYKRFNIQTAAYLTVAKLTPL